MPQSTPRWPRRLCLGLVALALLLIVPRYYPPARHPVDAAFLLQALFAGEDVAWLKRWTSPPRRLPADFEGLRVDLYLPGGGPEPPGAVRGCILLAHGMTDLGRRDPRLAAFARNLARLGFAVGVPELPGMRQFRADREDAGRISKSFLWMDQKFSRPGTACGLFAFSFAAGPAMMAAARSRLKGRTGYFIGLGAYYDLKAVLRHLTTGGRDAEPAFPEGPPVRVGKWLFLRYNMGILGIGAYRIELERIVRAKIADESADVSTSVGRLPERFRRLLALIENRDPRRFEALFGAQSGPMRAMLEEWSLRAALPKTRMSMFLLHGRSDPFVPPSESFRLAAEARRRGPGAGGVHLMVAESMSHVDPGGGTRWGRYLEGIRLLGFVSRVLTAMEGG